MSMYNKIFTKILDSSVWLEPTPTRIVWITMIAAMDETGFCQFAAVGNLASRARVSQDEAKKAVHALESPDPESGDQDNEGRRIERVPGGWIVLNAAKYRAIVTRVNAQERTRVRVQRFREKKRHGNGEVTQGNAGVPKSNDSPSVYPSTSSSDLVLTSEQITNRIMEDARISSDTVYREVNKQVKLEMGSAIEVHEDFANTISDRMCGAWLRFQNATSQMEYKWTAGKFFSEGYWRDEKTWPWKQDKAAVKRREREEALERPIEL